LTADEDGPERFRRLRRLGWFAAFWVAGVALTAAVAYFIRFALSFP
jgi:hypothetical protein